MARWDRMQRLDALLVGLGLAIGVAGVALAIFLRDDRPVLKPGEGPPGWSEVAWTLPVEPWWPSREFTCTALGCGAGLRLYVRIKIGFCNCKTGVADDEELERIGDFAMLARRHAPVAEGRPIAVGWMKGRSRSYTVEGKPHATAGDGRRALLIGYNDRCDAIVATAMLDGEDTGTAERSVLELLASPSVIAWTKTTLGL
jgi:hypothetical protein